MNTWSERIKSRLKELKLTQEFLAQKIGITRGAVTHYLAGRRAPSLKQFQKIAKILKVDAAWLQFGTSINTKQKNVTKNDTSIRGQHFIPIFSYKKIAEHASIKKIPKNEAIEFLKNFYTDKPHWYAARVIGDSMVASSSNFHENDFIIIDPEKNATHGNYVLALLPEAKEVTFKQFVIDSGIYYLKPFNTQYPIIKIDDTTIICGTVIHCIKFLNTKND